MKRRTASKPRLEPTPKPAPKSAPKPIGTKTPEKRGKSKGRANSNGSVYKMPDGRFRWQFTAGFDRNGKQLRIGGITVTKSEAQTAIAQAMVAKRNGSLMTLEKIGFEEFGRRWLEQQTDIAPNTRLSYGQSLEYAYEHIGGLKIRDVRPTHIRAMLAALSARVMKAGLGKGRTMSSRTLAFVRARVRAVFKEAVIDGLIASNPTEGVKRVKVARTEHPGVALEMDQVTRFRAIGEALHRAGQCRLWPALFTAVSIGLRRGEVMGLRWCDFDADEGLILVRQNLTTPGGKPDMRQPKTAESVREVLIPKSLRTALRRHRDLIVAEYAYCNAEVGVNDPMFPTVAGRFTHPDGLDRALKWLLAWSGIPGVAAVDQVAALEKKLLGIAVTDRPRIRAALLVGRQLQYISVHDLRHTATTLLIRQGMPLEVVSKMLGHSDLSITRLYRHVLESERRANVIDLFADSEDDPEDDAE